MKAKARIKFLKECEWWDKKRRILRDNGKSKYRYIIKRTCRNKDYKLVEKNLLVQDTIQIT